MWWIIGVSVLVGAILLFVVVPAVVQRAMAPSLRRRVSGLYSPEKIVLQDLRALSLGLESKGVMQLRGNGALVVTAGELHWFQFSPETDVRIPREAITGVKTVKAHLGKALGRDLLHVSFTVDGKPDSIAWSVMDVEAWLSELRKPERA